jgi:hypothetical protein
MTQVRPPGVYEDRTEQRFTPLRLAPSGIPAFLGLTQKGPTSLPVKIRSIDRFYEVYGRLGWNTYLEDAVRGYFENGGRECYILRTAHLGLKGRGEVARRAMARLRDADDRGSILVEARDEGVWGNEIRVSVLRSPPRVRTFLTIDIRKGDNEATIRSTHGFEVGTVVRIFDGDKESYRTILDLTGKRIRWIPSEPMEEEFQSGRPTYVEPVEFEIRARTPQAKEVFRELSFAVNSPNYFVRVVAQNSRLIQVDDLKSPSPMPRCLPNDAEDIKLAGGADGIYNVTPDDFIGMNLGPDKRFGLAALDVVEDLDLIAVPDLAWCVENSSGFQSTKDAEVVQHAVIDHCEQRRDRFAILDFLTPDDHVGAQQWRLMFDSPFAAFYFPWVVVQRPDGTRRSVPPCGHVAGIYSRSDQQFGTYRAPANEEMQGIVDLDLVLQEEDIGSLNHRGINCLKYFPARGIRIWGARTVSSDRALRYVNVRRTLNAIIRSLNTDLQWVVFEPNSPALWKTVHRNVAYFLSQLWEQGYFQGRSPEDAFYVKCDHETNPAEVRDAGQVVVEVGVAPVRPAEFIVFRVTQHMPEPDTAPGVGTS